MHSIFMLRCFNDCFAVLFFWLAVYCYQRNQWHLGSALYSTGLNVKMSLLLPLPAMGILMVMKLGGREALTQAMIMVQVSVSISDSRLFEVFGDKMQVVHRMISMLTDA
jgi:alpha-1,3-mannosyltransferase